MTHFIAQKHDLTAQNVVKLCLSLILLLSVVLPIQAQPARAHIIEAASDLRFALTDIAALFQSQTGQSVKLSFGSSGNMARQIRQGAPFEIYFSADENYVLGLFRDCLTRDQGALY